MLFAVYYGSFLEEPVTGLLYLTHKTRRKTRVSLSAFVCWTSPSGGHHRCRVNQVSANTCE